MYLIVFELALAQQLSVLVGLLLERRLNAAQPDVGLALFFTRVARFTFPPLAALLLPLEQPLVRGGVIKEINRSFSSLAK